MTELKIYKTATKGLKLLGMSLPFVLLGVWMIFESKLGSSDYIMGWIGTCFFGLGIPIGLIQLFDRRPQILINENGIWDRTTKQDVIKWEQIIDAYPLDIFDQKFVSIVSDDSFVFKKKTYKWATKLNRAIGAQNLNLHLGQTSVDENELTELIKNLAKAEKKSRREIIKSFKIRKSTFSFSSILKILVYISISIALLLVSLTGITAFMTIMIIMGIGAITTRWYWGSTEKSLIRKYAGIITWFGLINIVLCLATLKTYDYISAKVGLKLTTQIGQFQRQNFSYPTDFNSIKENAELNILEGVFANRIQYEVIGNNYELRTVNLFNRESTYDQDLEEWN